jgi:hypothetical protein
LPDTKTKLIPFQSYPDHRGDLTVCELPFDAKRTFWFEDVPLGEGRGRHAMKTCQMVMVAMRGHFDVVVDGERYRLDSPRTGLYVEPAAYRVLENFSPDALCLVLASEHFDEADYI